MSEGWICPKCGRALAPWMSECPCNYMKVEITSNYPVEFPQKPFNDYEQATSGTSLYDSATGRFINVVRYEHNE